MMSLPMEGFVESFLQCFKIGSSIILKQIVFIKHSSFQYILKHFNARIFSNIFENFIHEGTFKTFASKRTQCEDEM